MELKLKADEIIVDCTPEELAVFFTKQNDLRTEILTSIIDDMKKALEKS